MEENVPIAAFALSLMAGSFILLNGLAFAVVGSIIVLLFPPIGAATAALGIASLAGFGLIFGVAVLIGALMMYSKPEKIRSWSALVLVFSITSVLIGGGFMVGFVLGVVGGVLGLDWKPMSALVPVAGQMCFNCGRVYSTTFEDCPFCNKISTDKRGKEEVS
jgi:hypothetical protein